MRRSSLGRDKRNKRENRRVLEEVGAEWLMAATSFFNDVLLDSEKMLQVRDRLRPCQR